VRCPINQKHRRLAQPHTGLSGQIDGSENYFSTVEPILAGLRPLFERHSGMMLVTDVSVSRQEYFGKKGKGG
jgi:hypothetical protein